VKREEPALLGRSPGPGPSTLLRASSFGYGRNVRVYPERSRGARGRPLQAGAADAGSAKMLESPSRGRFMSITVLHGTPPR
jgi:hypothetical protein